MQHHSKEWYNNNYLRENEYNVELTKWHLYTKNNKYYCTGILENDNSIETDVIENLSLHKNYLSIITQNHHIYKLYYNNCINEFSVDIPLLKMIKSNK
tara:strand:- start:1901 stop:2194 length:294 start_codon:yes stop_codon:yes gene_type:complete